jgi:hypothetical protein
MTTGEMENTCLIILKTKGKYGNVRTEQNLT